MFIASRTDYELPFICKGIDLRSGGSCYVGKGRVWIGDPIESTPNPRNERAVGPCPGVDRRQVLKHVGATAELAVGSARGSTDSTTAK